MIGSANRDSGHFQQADRFRIERLDPHAEMLHVVSVLFGLSSRHEIEQTIADAQLHENDRLLDGALDGRTEHAAIESELQRAPRERPDHRDILTALAGESCQLLVYLNDPSVAAKGMAKLREAPTQEEQLAYIRDLRVRVGCGYEGTAYTQKHIRTNLCSCFLSFSQKLLHLFASLCDVFIESQHERVDDVLKISAPQL